MHRHLSTRLTALAAAFGVTGLMLTGMHGLAQHESQDLRLAQLAQQAAAERVAATDPAHGCPLTPAAEAHG
ncbi:MAG: hypothetical protein ACLGIT_00685 [Gammaproteobacteria bacterium]|uniref:hypothetical protein n=1 Tax=Azohydromonas sp. TaxID=1872666 RepID=UPI002CB74A5A|nr:hypothetical protein [Azohydromonas sp.]HMM85519.1 hypothetical protein [Azohydromonas sp.]